MNAIDSIITAKARDRERIAQDVADFIAKGGKVQSIGTTQNPKGMTFRDVNVCMGSEAAARVTR